MYPHPIATGLAIASALITSSPSLTIFASALANTKPTTSNKMISRDPFYSPAGRFSIDFPIPPVASTHHDENGNQVTQFVTEHSQTTYTVSYFDKSNFQDLSPPATEQAIDEVLQDFYLVARGNLWGYHLLHSKNIQLGNQVGREVKFTVENKISLARTYIVNGRCYSISVETTTDAHPINSNFLDSFRLR
jgi:hypothetical protein